MRRLQKIMGTTLALLMVLRSLPIWAEGEPIVIVESTETPAPQAEKEPGCSENHFRANNFGAKAEKGSAAF